MIRTRATVFAVITSVALAGAAASAQAASYQVVYAFQGGSDGAFPWESLINVGGNLYGITNIGGSSNCGTVFAFDPVSGAERVVYSFKNGSDGAYPQGSLLKVGSRLYGTTAAGGGTSGFGAVFSLSPTTGAEKVLYSFKGGSDGGAPRAGLINVGNTLYGTTAAGTVFSLNPATGTEKVVYSLGEATGPQSTPLYLGGTLYGTTEGGGSPECGTVFSLNLPTGIGQVAYSFQCGSDGAYSMAGLINVGGMLYGTTLEGGGTSTDNLNGTVFSFNPTTGAEQVVYSFQNGKDGAEPYASVISVGESLYGTTIAGGGALGLGTVFSLNRTTGVERVLHSFHGGSDGGMPEGGLINVGGTLYGTTIGGEGGNGYGTVFALKP